LGAHIKIALSLIQEEKVLIRKSVRQCQVELTRPDSVRPALYEDQERRDNIIELSRFRGDNYQPPALGSNDILLQGRVSTDASKPAREPFIQRYRQTQGSNIYLENKSSFEISI
jgi:hypothetical protein